MVSKIISGGQTGVDRAALDAAIALGYPIGGYVPKGRIAEDGAVPIKYPMTETASADYTDRTKRNIAACGATIILIQNERDMRGGTLLTRRIVAESACCVGCVIDMSKPNASVVMRNFWSVIEKAEPLVTVVNFAGPRESKSPGIYRAAYEFIFTNVPAARNT